MTKPKLIRVTTVPLSLKTLLKGQLRFMNENGFEVLGVSSPGKDLKDVEENEGIRCIPIEMSRFITPFKDLKSLWQFYRFCKTEKPLVVHSHTPKAGLIAMLGAGLANVPLRLHTIAGLPLMETDGFKRKLLIATEKLTCYFATRIYPNSNELNKFILENRFTTEKKLKVLGNGSSNGIDTDAFDPNLITEQRKQDLRESLNIGKEDFVFIFVGRLVGDKGINELVKAFSQLEKTKDGAAIKLILVGPQETNLDPLKPETLTLINDHPDILEVGFQSDVQLYFSISDVLAFPSYREGFPNVVLQAAAMELPCIVTNINGCNEIITENENGWLIPAKDAEKLRERMNWCYLNREEFQDMGTRSRKIIKERFDRKIIWNELLNEYKELIQGAMK